MKRPTSSRPHPGCPTVRDQQTPWHCKRERERDVNACRFRSAHVHFPPAADRRLRCSSHAEAPHRLRGRRVPVGRLDELADLEPVRGTRRQVEPQPTVRTVAGRHEEALVAKEELGEAGVVVAVHFRMGHRSLFRLGPAGRSSSSANLDFAGSWASSKYRVTTASASSSVSMFRYLSR